MRYRGACLVGGLLLVALGLPAAGEEKPVPEEAVFDLREVSVFDAAGPQSVTLTRGQYAECVNEPDKAVKAYPKLKSKKPLYGKVKFGWYPGKNEGIEIHFALDESGEPAPDKTEANPREEVKKKEPASSSDKPSEAKPSSYDRLYLDLNRDLDLTNDVPLRPMKEPPWQSLPRWTVRERQAFEFVAVDFDYGPGLGIRPFRIFPWLTVSEDSKYVTMHFVAVAAREGRIEIGKRKYDVLLAQPYIISGRFDRSPTVLNLTPVGHKELVSSSGFDSEMLSTMRRFGGVLYTFATTPTGDKLIVKPYRGDYGVLEIGPGGRDIKGMSLVGSLRSEATAIEVGSHISLLKTKRVRVPVGDYVPSHLSIEYGSLRIAISDNYHSDGHSRDRERVPTYGLKIRKDKPFVLDFSNKPAVLFASPAKGQTVKLGDEVRVAAVLVDPVLDVMIRRLDDTKQTEKQTYKRPDGKDVSFERPKSLDPVVAVTDSTGKTIAEGKMPFG
jgi:hypothetical protein